MAKTSSPAPTFNVTTPIGVIADTHGLLREPAIKELGGCELIVHMGDIGDEDILKRLGEVARLFAVRGNNDTQTWAINLPETQNLIVNGWRLHLIHNIAEFDPQTPCDAVLHGHSHKPRNEWDNERLLFNPGGAGKRRFKLPITVGKLWVTEPKLKGEIIYLNLT